MSNWVAYKETEIGLPVFKRAVHGIHFKQGDGSILAEFTGAPCHYFNGKEYKAIDTKLIAVGDGFYGSHHSDVFIHPDGRVKVGGYQQKSTLVTAKTGTVDGDRIVREFKFGTQYLYMKEDGFRQETIITRTPTTAEAKFLIATESGELPGKYHKSPITAIDAKGDVHVFTSLGQFKKWLDAANYPVTIDPDFAAGTGNKRIYGTGTFAAARATSGGSDSDWLSLGCQPGWYIYRVFVSFDTSSIGDGDTITQVNLNLTVAGDVTTVDTDCQIVKQDWSSGDREAHYDGCLAGTADDAILGSTGTGTWSGGTKKTSGNLATAYVSKTGVTYYSLRTSHDYDNSEPASDSWLYFHPQGSATESYRPTLTVAYEAGAAGNPHYYYAQLQ